MDSRTQDQATGDASSPDAAASPDLPWPLDSGSGDLPPPPTGVLWAQSFGDTSQETGRAVAVDPSGNVTITGHFSGSVDFGDGVVRTSAGTGDIFVASYTAAGAFRWAKTFGGPYEDLGLAVAADSAGNVTVTGAFRGSSINPGGGPLANANPSGTTSDILLASYSSAGAFRWAKRFGGAGSDSGTDVAVDSAGNVYLTGGFSFDVDFGGGVLKGTLNSDDIFVASYDANGTHRWSQAYGWSYDDQGNGIAVDSSDNVYVTGNFSDNTSFGCPKTLSGGTSPWIFLVSYTGSSGACRWAKSFGGQGTDVGQAVAVDPGGNVTLTGSFEGTVDFGGGPLTATGTSDIVLASFNSANGDYRWAQRLGGAATEAGNHVAADASGNTFVIGFFSGTAAFGGTPLTNAGPADIFVYSTTAAGAPRWVKQLGGALGDVGYGVAVSAGSLYATGFFQGTVSFGAAVLSSAGNSDIFLLRLQP